MYVSSHHSSTPWPQIFRWLGRASGVALFVCWVVLLAMEWSRPGPPIRGIGLVLQAMALMAVFIGYAIGWKREMLGAWVSLGGLAAFVLVNLIDLERLPDPAFVWFAAPGILYLLAARRNKHHEVVMRDVG
jgi:hypothetical protein